MIAVSVRLWMSVPIETSRNFIHSVFMDRLQRLSGEAELQLLGYDTSPKLATEPAA
jgi:hypothetical protein